MTVPRRRLLCGLPGSGKTTLANCLEVDLPALRLTEDEWVARPFSPDAVHDEAIRITFKDARWDLTVRTIQLGNHAVLDWGAWSREE